MINKNLSIEDLYKMFNVNFETGELFWKWHPSKNSNRVLGKKIGSFYKTPYLRFEYYGKYYAVHRVILAMYLGKWPDVVDHINGDCADNRIVNLRNVSVATNSQNKRIHREGLPTNCQKRPGNRSKPYAVRATINGKRKYIGYAATKEEAVKIFKDYNASIG